MPSVFFYISGHGFGHAARQIEIINALGPRLPDSHRVVVRTAAARWLFTRTVRPPMTLLSGPCDTGVVQFDSLRLDQAATAAAAAEFYGSLEERIASEEALLTAYGACLVISDAPPLACAAAAAAGVPSIVISNFTWDWIYQGYPEAFSRSPQVIPMIQDAYRKTRDAWRLPMGGGFATFEAVRDFPFVARHATRSRADVRSLLGLPPDRRLALSSFGGYGLRDLRWDALDSSDTWTVVAPSHDGAGPRVPGVACVSESRMYDAGLRYEDLVHAVDVVVSKPGYGIISECIANGAALLYTSRGRFAEYDVMVREMPRVLRCRYLGQEALLAGRWRDALEALRSAPPPPVQPSTNGADLIADAILRML